MNNTRFDIQFMRGVAVLFVVLFHALPTVFPKGYIGVDVFFVISGFLITGMMLRQIEEGSFRFSTFYIRRARRLLPASLTTFAVTTILALWLLPPSDLAEFGKQLIGALTFTSNFVLMFQTGYFDGEASTKPLLHIWSLSLEEQFYFIAPLVLLLASKRWRVPLLFSSAVLSAAFCFILVGSASLPILTSGEASQIAFFMLPTRAWELLVGGLTAAAMIRWPTSIPRWVNYAALLVILFVCIRGVSMIHPGADALIAVLATATILLGQNDWLRINILTRPVGVVGDWSYSVYLVHWPLFAFASIVWLGKPPAELMLALAAISLLLGFAQYQLVERPCHRGLVQSKLLWATVCGTSVVLGSVGTYLVLLPRLVDPNTAPIAGLADNCQQTGPVWRDLPRCRTSTQPTVMLWGDSYAMHLVPGLLPALEPDNSLIQASMYACSPTLGVAQVGAKYSPTWSADCLRHNANVAESLKILKSVKYVIIASSYRQVFSEGIYKLNIDGIVAPYEPIAEQRLEQSVRAVQGAGKIAILIGPTPVAPFDIGSCITRLRSGRPVLGNPGCRVSREAVEAKVGDINRALIAVGRRTGATVVLPTDVLCSSIECVTQESGIGLYRDTGHLSLLGSKALVDRLDLRELVSSPLVGRTAP